MNNSQRNDVGLLTWSDLAEGLDALERKLSGLAVQNAILGRRLAELEEAAVTKPKRARGFGFAPSRFSRS